VVTARESVLELHLSERAEYLLDIAESRLGTVRTLLPPGADGPPFLGMPLTSSTAGTVGAERGHSYSSPHRPIYLGRTSCVGAPDPSSLAIAVSNRRTRVALALPLFREAFEDARSTGRGEWEFALTLRELLAIGLMTTDLRWLVAEGVIAHAVERIEKAKGQRLFDAIPDLAITERSCFVLTVGGVDRINSLALKERSQDNDPHPAAPGLEHPCWDAMRRELTWQGGLVKRFRTPAPCQETILAAFEEEQWPPRIDDPLKGSPLQDPKQRLHDVVRCLNRNQVQRRIRFRRDGTGEGICWDV
jgi:hypothetical protein